MHVQCVYVGVYGGMCTYTCMYIGRGILFIYLFVCLIFFLFFVNFACTFFNFCRVGIFTGTVGMTVVVKVMSTTHERAQLYTDHQGQIGLR